MTKAFNFMRKNMTIGFTVALLISGCAGGPFAVVQVTRRIHAKPIAGCGFCPRS